MTVYAVFKTGVYRHECGGVYSTKEAAVGAADLLASIEPDDYHSFEVIPWELDRVPEIVPDPHEYRFEDGAKRRRMADEPESVYTVQAMGPVPPHKITHITNNAGALCGSKWSQGYPEAMAELASVRNNRHTCQECLAARGKR